MGIKTLHIDSCEECYKKVSHRKTSDSKYDYFWCVESERSIEDIKNIPTWCELKDYIG